MTVPVVCDLDEEPYLLIAGPADFICDECLDLCTEIIIEEAEEADGEGPEPPVPPPREPLEASTREEIRRAVLPQLTDGEKEALGLLERGSNAAQIASALGTSKNVVRTHTQSILTKLHRHSRNGP